MQHWTKLLPESGTDSFAREAQDIEERLSALEAQLAILRKVKLEREEEALRWAKKYWTEEEIAEAKNQAKNQAMNLQKTS